MLLVVMWWLFYMKEGSYLSGATSNKSIAMFICLTSSHLPLQIMICRCWFLSITFVCIWMWRSKRQYEILRPNYFVSPFLLTSSTLRSELRTKGSRSTVDVSWYSLINKHIFRIICVCVFYPCVCCSNIMADRDVAGPYKALWNCVFSLLIGPITSIALWLV